MDSCQSQTLSKVERRKNFHAPFVRSALSLYLKQTQTSQENRNAC